MPSLPTHHMSVNFYMYDSRNCSLLQIHLLVHQKVPYPPDFRASEGLNKLSGSDVSAVLYIDKVVSRTEHSAHMDSNRPKRRKKLGDFTCNEANVALG
jgi:hypothetical protein